MMNSMLLVVLEGTELVLALGCCNVPMFSLLLLPISVKAEVVCRVVVAVATVLLFFLRDPSDVSTTIPVTLSLGTVIFVIDAAYHRRRFTAAYWRRLGLIGALAGAGAGLFSLLKLLSFTHGVWHLCECARSLCR